jgi:hypothetical protein
MLSFLQAIFPLFLDIFIVELSMFQQHFESKNEVFYEITKYSGGG